MPIKQQWMLTDRNCHGGSSLQKVKAGRSPRWHVQFSTLQRGQKEIDRDVELVSTLYFSQLCRQLSRERRNTALHWVPLFVWWCSTKLTCAAWRKFSAPNVFPLVECSFLHPMLTCAKCKKKKENLRQILYYAFLNASCSLTNWNKTFTRNYAWNIATINLHICWLDIAKNFSLFFLLLLLLHTFVKDLGLNRNAKVSRCVIKNSSLDGASTVMVEQ